jgi:hypothetical protein
MSRRLFTAIAVTVGVLATGSVSAQGVVQRFVLVAGANSGGADRPTLRYATTDADRFAKVLVDLGGVGAADTIVLKEPKVRDLVQALDRLNQRVIDARRQAGPGGRTEVLVYYSGHADDKGLMLGDDRYSYRTLRDRLDDIPADVRIAVLDACASGAFTRLKGGKSRQPFLVDPATSMKGYAFLTSSAETEAAQESDHLRASYFTYYLVSGLRGAADMSGDGRVTLNEAYQFAFNETLGRTVSTQGGAQHPSYDINLSGAGDVTMTDIRQTTASLVLAEPLDGRVFVKDGHQQLVVELYKQPGRAVNLALEPGAYEVRIERQNEAWLAKTQLVDGQRLELGLEKFAPTTTEPTRRRGDLPPSFAVAGRNRLELRVSFWRGGETSEPEGPVFIGSETNDLFGGLQYTRFLKENLAFTLGAETLSMHSSVSTGLSSSTGSVVVASVPFGLRWNPLGGDHRTRALKPFLACAVGPVIGSSSGVEAEDGTVFIGTRNAATAGGYVGAGVDVLTGRHISLGINAGYNWMLDFRKTVGGRDNYSGFTVSLGIGWMFGKGYQ